MMADGGYDRFAEMDAQDAAHRAEKGEVFYPGMRVHNMRDGTTGTIGKITVKGDIWVHPDGTQKENLILELRSTLSAISGQNEEIKLRPRAKALLDQIKSFSAVQSVLSGRYLVKGWLDRGTFSVVYGESNVGKTFFALDLAMHVAAFQNWHGNLVPRKSGDHPGPVVYVAGEGGAGINNPIAAIRTERGDLWEGIQLWDGFHLLPTTLDLCTSTDAAHLAAVLVRAWPKPPSLIIIDTLARSMGNGDENTAKDMGAFVRSVDFLREKTGAHVMVIHHSGKDTTKGARGSGSLRAAADTEIELTRDGDTILAETKKQRDMPTGSIFAYKLKGVFLGHDEDGDAITTAVVQEVEAPAKRAPRLKGQALIAMQAFGDALAAHGAVKHGSDFPPNRQCVSLDHWREACDRHSLTDGDSDSAKRTAFGRAWKALQEKQIVRVIDGFAWRCADE